jgi:hypothetical protein
MFQAPPKKARIPGQGADPKSCVGRTNGFGVFFLGARYSSIAASIRWKWCTPVSLVGEYRPRP